MKKIITAAIAMLALSPAAYAQTTATSGSNSAATGLAQNAGVQQEITFKSQTPESQRIHTTASPGGNSYYGSFSPDSCEVSGGGGVGGTGLVFNMVVPVKSMECYDLRAFERTMQAGATFQAVGDHRTAAMLRQASVDILCQVTEHAKKALQYQGLCSDFDKQYAVPAPMPVILAAPSVAATLHGRIGPDGVTYER